MASVETVLEVKSLTTVFDLKLGQIQSVNDVSFDLRRGEILGLVGESGSWKSVTGLSIMGLVSAPGRIVGGSIRLHGEELTRKADDAMRRLRGREISMIFQDPMTTLNPVLSIGRQFYEAIRAHRKTRMSSALKEAEAALAEVGIPAPKERLKAYPHELSGGMRQRVCIAISLINSPSVIIADEPTTALDVTIQSQILHMMQRIVRERNVSMIWVTHDLSIVAGLCQRVAVMYGGRLVELGPVNNVLRSPAHPYTRGLLDSIPGDTPAGRKLSQIPGTQPSPLDLPDGCAFRSRCFKAAEKCTQTPEFFDLSENRKVRCFFPLSENVDVDH